MKATTPRGTRTREIWMPLGRRARGARLRLDQLPHVHARLLTKSRSAPGFPGRSERLGVWGPFRGPHPDRRPFRVPHLNSRAMSGPPSQQHEVVAVDDFVEA